MNQEYKTKSIDHLGLVSGMCDELSIVETIDRLIPQDASRFVSVGKLTKALILNGLGFVQRRLYLVSHFFEDKPVEHLIGEGISASFLNDDALGRALDDIYDFGCTALFTELAKKACHNLGLDSRSIHIDTTSIHVDGSYNSQNPPQDETILYITKGYSRDHRPDLNQVILNLITENRAGIPVQMEVLNGNSDDKTTFRETITKHIAQLKNDHSIQYVVGDSAFYTAETLNKLSSEVFWISRVPEVLNECKETIMNMNIHQMFFLQEGYKYSTISSNYSGIPQRWLVVWSEQAYTRELKTLEKNYLKKTQEHHKNFEQLCRQEFACKEDAEKALSKFQKENPNLEINNTQTEQFAQYKGKGRPKKDTIPFSYIYRITGIVSCTLIHYNNERKKKGFFILATNQLNQDALTDKELFIEYKEQGKVERGFRFIKDPHFMASTIFIKKPQRVAAILMIMTLCLTVYAALEYNLRKALKEQNQKIPDQKKKPTDQPTMRWIFALFVGIDILYINKKHYKKCLNINKTHHTVINLLGANFKKYYFSD